MRLWRRQGIVSFVLGLVYWRVFLSSFFFLLFNLIILLLLLF